MEIEIYIARAQGTILASSAEMFMPVAEVLKLVLDGHCLTTMQ